MTVLPNQDCVGTSAGFRSHLAWYNMYQYRVAQQCPRLVGNIGIKHSIQCTAGKIFFLHNMVLTCIKLISGVVLSPDIMTTTPQALMSKCVTSTGPLASPSLEQMQILVQKEAPGTSSAGV